MINPYDYDLAVAENAALFLLMLVGNVACKGRSSPQVINRRSKEPEGVSRSFLSVATGTSARHSSYQRPLGLRHLTLTASHF
jgi:hypothetical protein